MDLPAEKSAAAAWMKMTFALPADLDLNGLGTLAVDTRLVRGETFWKLGLYNEAQAEYEDLRQSLESDPANLFRLVSYLHDVGLYRSVIMGSRQILTLAHMDDAGTRKAPAYFNHLRFGPYYKDLVLPGAQAEELDPLLVFSLMRQESLFEGFIQSDVGARGLMQIMPETGDGIAANMGWPAAYTSDDLYRPVVSVRMGIHYLAQQLDYLSGSLYAALAAYNGGPGNALSWYDLAGDDPDLFLEVVRIQQTRDYIMRIFEIYGFYRMLYDRTP
jgi:soluble lytic murein transglycosylase